MQIRIRHVLTLVPTAKLLFQSRIQCALQTPLVCCMFLNCRQFAAFLLDVLIIALLQSGPASIRQFCLRFTPIYQDDTSAPAVAYPHKSRPINKNRGQAAQFMTFPYNPGSRLQHFILFIFQSLLLVLPLLRAFRQTAFHFMAFTTSGSILPCHS